VPWLVDIPRALPALLQALERLVRSGDDLRAVASVLVMDALLDTTSACPLPSSSSSSSLMTADFRAVARLVQAGALFSSELASHRAWMVALRPAAALGAGYSLEMSVGPIMTTGQAVAAGTGVASFAPPLTASPNPAHTIGSGAGVGFGDGRAEAEEAFERATEHHWSPCPLLLAAASARTIHHCLWDSLKLGHGHGHGAAPSLAHFALLERLYTGLAGHGDEAWGERTGQAALRVALEVLTCSAVLASHTSSSFSSSSLSFFEEMEKHHDHHHHHHQQQQQQQQGGRGSVTASHGLGGAAAEVEVVDLLSQSQPCSQDDHDGDSAGAGAGAGAGGKSVEERVFTFLEGTFKRAAHASSTPGSGSDSCDVGYSDVLCLCMWVLPTVLATTGSSKTQVSQLAALLQHPSFLASLPLPPSMAITTASPSLGSAKRKAEARNSIWTDMVASLLSVSLLHVHCDMWDPSRGSGGGRDKTALNEKGLCRLLAVKIAPLVRSSSSSSSSGSAVSSSQEGRVEFEVWRALLRASVPVPVAARALDYLSLYTGAKSA
jgi:hypothetical protein